MNVKQLIEYLKTLDPELLVLTPEPFPMRVTEDDFEEVSLVNLDSPNLPSVDTLYLPSGKAVSNR